MGIWPFKKKVLSLKESDILNGFVDWHSHILPGVDDGIKTFEESIEVLKEFEKLGVRKMWLTPHIMEDYPNTTHDLRQRFEELKLAYDGPIELHLGAENMIDAMFEERFESRDLLPIGEEGTHLLVETSYFNPPMNMSGILNKIMKAGYYPVLAHPERYRYMEERDYISLHEKGVLFQGNLSALVGRYGETAKRKLEWLIKKGFISFWGTDLHRFEPFVNALEMSPSKQEYLDEALRIAASPGIA